MLRSLILFSLFFGLISMILPEDRRGEWIRLLLIVVMFLSVGVNLFFGSSFDFEFDLPDPAKISGEAEREALHASVRARVFALTGSAPLSVESDLSVEGEQVTLTEIRVVIREGDREEVLNDLKRYFSFEGFLVFCEETRRIGEAVPVLP